ncbi:unnamed protein product [Sphacelaria rigidula]
MEMAIHIHVESIRLFDHPINLLGTHLLYFFVTFTVECCYLCRVIRLGVAYSVKLKRAIPWVMSQKLLVGFSLVVGLLSLSIPIYYYVDTAGENHQLSFAIKEHDVVWRCQVALVTIQLSVLPVVWMVNDIFRISWELVVIIMVALVDAVATKIAERYEPSERVQMFINSSNFGILSTMILFGLSVVDPIRRLALNPLPKGAAPRTNVSSRSRANEDQEEREISWPHYLASVTLGASVWEHGVTTSMPSSASTGIESPKWSYDKMAQMPAVAEAFRAFAWRALCQESVMFLEEVRKYETGDYKIAHPVNSQYAAFNAIVGRFIIDGSSDEINISAKDKETLISIHKVGAVEFFTLQEEERRMIFQPAFLEIRSMLEVNLLHRFIDTEDFRSGVQLQTPPRFPHQRHSRKQSTQSTVSRASSSSTAPLAAETPC